jgi:hypothetical protein
VGWDF